MKDNNNNKSIIIVIAILVIILLLFALIRGCDKKEETKVDTNNNTEEVVTEEEATIEEVDSYYTTTTTPTVTKVAAKTEDKQILTLSLVGEDIVYVDYNTTYTEEGAFASDTVDGTITDKIITKIYLIETDPTTAEEIKTEVEEVDATIPGAIYEIEYSVTNSNKETKTLTRKVVIKDVKSVLFELIGDKEVAMELGDIYIEKNVNAIETINGVEEFLNVVINYYEVDPITLEQTKIEAIDTNKLAMYTVIYTTIDSNGDEYNLTRNVTIIDTNAPVVTTTDNKKEFYFTADAASNEVVDLEKLYKVEDKDTNLTAEYVITSVLNNDKLENIPMNVEGEYTVEVKVTDSSNNISNPVTFKVIINGVDTKAPTITIVEETTENDDKTITTIKITVNATDEYTNSEDMKLYYVYMDTNYTTEDLESATWTELETNELSYEYNTNTATDKILVIKAVDEVGNEATYNHNTKQN